MGKSAGGKADKGGGEMSLKDARDNIEQALENIRQAKEAQDMETSQEFLLTAKLLLNDAIDEIANVADDIDSAYLLLKPNREV